MLKRSRKTFILVGAVTWITIDFKRYILNNLIQLLIMCKNSITSLSFYIENVDIILKTYTISGLRFKHHICFNNSKSLKINRKAKNH